MPAEVLADGTYVLDNPVPLPDVLDMLIVGGGPAGTAAAFRAKELGITALVVEMDDILKRIRDYPKDKLILPDYGGADTMKFPKGNDLIAHLYFNPIDKDDLCTKWRSLYRSFSVPAKIGVELTGLEQQADGIWVAKTWNHRIQAEEAYRAKHVVLAMGRGVPRRFDIPGNTDGLAFRLDDPERYVGHPVCVIGGGTSAAEAVIAISTAKARAEDRCPVYWSYRGDKMPRVSKALDSVFFGAFIGNGNIRYRPKTEPAAVITAPDRKEYLSIRMDRKELTDRPSETNHLEFDKAYCIACIGEDLPTAFLGSIGIHMVTGGPRNKKRMTVTPLLESQQPNVYLVASLLANAYLEADNVNGDPDTFRERKQSDNIKSSMRHGVLVAQIIKQRLEDKDVVSVEILDADADAAPDGPPETKTVEVMITKTDAPGEPTVGDDTVSDAFLVRITPGEVEAEQYPVSQHAITTIGRKGTTITITEDTALSDNHASISYNDGGFYLRDDGSELGTFFQLQPAKPMALEVGDLVRVGKQYLMLHKEADQPVALHYDQNATLVNRYPVTATNSILGRKTPTGRKDPDVSLSETDMTLSRWHVSLVLREGRVIIEDRGSANGTYLRVRTPIPLSDEDAFRVGRQLFRFDVRKEAEERPTDLRDLDQGVVVAPDEPPAEVPAEPAAPAEAPSVTFKGHTGALAVQPGQSLLEIAKANNVPIDYMCKMGACGMDPIRIVSGSQYLNPCGDRELDVLEDMLELDAGNDPGHCRFACMAKITGPVVVEVVEKD